MRSAQAQLLQAALAVGYVSSIYVHPNGRLRFSHQSQPNGVTVKSRSRNDPTVIRTRLVAVSVATVLSCVAVGVAVWAEGGRWGREQPSLDAVWATVDLLGLSVAAPSWNSAVHYLLVPLLYAGPIFTLGLESSLPFQRHWSFKNDVVKTFTSLQGLRNYVVSPITEEVVFRSCIISIAYLADDSWRRMVFLTPLWFGVAHAHHAWETFNNLGRTRKAAINAIAGSVFQLAYTTLFGWFTAYLFVRTNSTYAACFSHIFCNFMGLPAIGQDLQRHPRSKLLIYLSHIVGIVGFGYALVPWTRRT